GSQPKPPGRPPRRVGPPGGIARPGTDEGWRKTQHSNYHSRAGLLGGLACNGALELAEPCAGTPAGGACGAACLGFAAGSAAGAEAAGAGTFLRNSIALPVPTSICRRFSSVISGARTICGVMANIISFSVCCLLSCANRYFSRGSLLIHGQPLMDCVSVSSRMPPSRFTSPSTSRVSC